MPDTHGRWCLVVPVKRLALAKTRMSPAYDLHRRDLALAFALDTTKAALASDAVRAVLVVTDEPEVADLLAAAGADVVGDEPDAGLNPALAHGAAAAAAAHPGCGVGALSADLPSLRSAELSRALERAASHETSFVRDAAGIGTTLVLARSLPAFRPEFGADSARRHAAAGCAEIAGDDIPSVRQDVDTNDDLAVARLLGLGPQTSQLLAGIREVG
ncbi:MAG: 2-phospho-L-lactate guanylyltransferase [Spirochaetaceae bacterium]|nr:2-phospho-L-lactate guanylyltransferase [Spirochaetaceae bacterium]